MGIEKPNLLAREPRTITGLINDLIPSKFQRLSYRRDHYKFNQQDVAEVIHYSEKDPKLL